MASPECIKDIILESNPDADMIKGFDKALIGTGRICGIGSLVAVYDADICIQILIDEHGMEEQEAFEHFTAIIEGKGITKNRPIFVNDFRKAIEPKSEKEDGWI